MIITPLGHTEFLVDIANPAGENVRILVDAWFSDYAFGDLMERSVKVTLDPEKLDSIDAIYISHSHCDHLDPYTLISLYRACSQKKPLLILPYTLRYLSGIFAEFLGEVSIHWLGNREKFVLRGIEITGHMFAQSDITNEDDVMMLSIANDRELLFAEIDMLPDEYDLEVQNELYRIFTKKEYETVCYLASRNELEGQLPYYDIAPSKRRAFRDQYIANRKDEIRAGYEKYEYEEYQDFPNLATLPGFVKGYIGQGIRYPEKCSTSLAGLSIWGLDEIASLETDIVKSLGYDLVAKALLPGRQYRVESGSIEPGRKECPIGSLTVPREKVNPAEAEERSYILTPMFPRTLSSDEIITGKKNILDALNHRFLPYWSASPVASLRDALLKNKDGAYRISFSLADDTLSPIIFEFSLGSCGFQEVEYREGMKFDETYFFTDILDFLGGKLELYSNFWHKLDPKKIYRLWTCLGANFMNHDILEKKYRYHFERAQSGFSSDDFVEGIIKNLIS